MSLSDYKITVYKNPVAGLPDSPSDAGMSTQELKAAFDANANNEIKAAINAIIEHVDIQDEANKEAFESKVDKAEGKGLSTNDYTTEEKNIVAGVINKADKSNVIEKDSTEAFTPTERTHPANKGYVDDAINLKAQEIGKGDMMQAVYDPDGKRTDIFAYAAPAEEHRIKTYTSYTQLGLAVGDIVADDFLGNMQKIFEAMPEHSAITIRTYNSNLSESLAAKINEDLGTTLLRANYYTIWFEKNLKTEVSRLNVIFDSLGNEIMYTCMFNNVTSSDPAEYRLSPFIRSYAKEGFYSKNQNIEIKKDTPTINLANTATGGSVAIQDYSHQLLIQIKKSDDEGSKDRRVIVLRDTASSSPNLANALALRNYVDGKYTNYDIFGEHNQELIKVPATWNAITALNAGEPYSDSACGYWVCGKQITLSMYIKSGFSFTENTNQTIFTMPSGFRPSRQVHAPAYVNYGQYNRPVKVAVNTDGTVDLWSSYTFTSNGITAFQITFFIE